VQRLDANNCSLNKIKSRLAGFLGVITGALGAGAQNKLEYRMAKLGRILAIIFLLTIIAITFTVVAWNKYGFLAPAKPPFGF
jgi:1,4-dihydroxy-2-naphthoate octaprenyltransferase